jgi:hypothetical protein
VNYSAFFEIKYLKPVSISNRSEYFYIIKKISTTILKIH